MNRTIRSMALAATLVLTLTGSAHAAGKRFTTPLLSTAATDLFVCSVINVDKKPATVDVKIVRRDGTLVTAAATDCEAPVAPNTGCRVAGPTGTTTAYCDVLSSSGKVRVDLIVLDGNTPNRTLAVVPGTLK